jgi:hypothetical protein
VTTLLAAVLAALLWAAPSSACAACACGSTAALPVGAELPFAGRWRVALSTQAFSTTTADPLGDVLLQGGTGAVTIVAAVTDAIVVDVSLPLSLRLRRTGGTIDGRSMGMGDMALGARLVWTDRAFGPHLALSVRVGAMLPTSLTLTGGDGSPLSTSMQPGFAALAPQLQLTGVWLLSTTTSLLGSLSATAPLVGRRDTLGAAVVEARLLGLGRASERVSVRGGLVARGVSDTISADALDGSHRDGEARAAVGPEVGVTVDIDTDVALAATASVPVVGIGGAVTEGGRAELTLIIDW